MVAYTNLKGVGWGRDACKGLGCMQGPLMATDEAREARAAPDRSPATRAPAGMHATGWDACNEGGGFLFVVKTRARRGSSPCAISFQAEHPLAVAEQPLAPNPDGCLALHTGIVCVGVCGVCGGCGVCVGGRGGHEDGTAWEGRVCVDTHGACLQAISGEESSFPAFFPVQRVAEVL